jgi:hypothetical protein
VSDEKTLSAERIAELSALARRLIEHPEDIAEAEARGDLADLLGLTVVLADLFLPRSFTLADLIPQEHQVLERDPQLYALLLDDMCARYQGGEIAVTPVLLPMLARFFRDWNKHVTAQGEREGKKSGAQQVPRAVDILVHLHGRTVAQAAEVVATMTGRDPKSVEAQYYAYLKKEKNLHEK